MDNASAQRGVLLDLLAIAKKIAGKLTFFLFLFALGEEKGLLDRRYSPHIPR